MKRYKSFFDFSKITLTESRFQDNSHLRIIKNWEDKPSGQTYAL
jgi:hypothetical protein